MKKRKNVSAKLVAVTALFPDGSSKVGWTVNQPTGLILGFIDHTRAFCPVPFGTVFVEFAGETFRVTPDYPDALKIALKPNAYLEGYRHADVAITSMPANILRVIQMAGR